MSHGLTSGEAEDYSGFLLQVSLYFSMQEHQFINDSARVAFIISLLSGQALQWAQSLWNSDSEVVKSLSGFIQHFKEVFGQTAADLSVHDQLYNLRQGQSSVSTFSLRFRTLAASSGWNEAALITAFRHGLNPNIRQLMVVYDDSLGIEKLIQKSIRVSQRLSACDSPTPTVCPPPTVPSVTPPAPEPMDLGSAHLPASERQRRILHKLCLYCASDNHLLSSCPVRPPCPAVSTIQVSPKIEALNRTTVHVLTSRICVSAQALIDSGSAGNFISTQLLQKLNIHKHRNSQDLHVQTIQGKPLGRGRIRHCSPTLTLRVGCLHSEEISFMVLEESTAELILGRPWLVQHQPTLHWKSGEVLRWGESCHLSCLSSIKKIPSSSSTPQKRSKVPVCSTSVESPEVEHQVEIPVEYQAYQDVFSKKLATKLPPHRPWDCAIDLLPGATLPKGCIYPLSIPEQKAIEEYVEEALQQQFIRTSTSPAASSFFFVGKKDGGLRPCIDYRHLNSQTVKYSYPLPLVPAALEQVRGARIFSKLDLRSAYNLIRIRHGDEWKTAFVTPSGHYEYQVMPFGLSNTPAVFQGYMNEVFREYLNRFVIVYIDDILIYSSSIAEHHRHVIQVLEKLREHKLYLKLEKCEFHITSVQFLGYIIDQHGIQMDQRKVETIQDWPLPTSVKELQRFLGFANFYRRFIKNYSLISAPLTSSLKNRPKSLSLNPTAIQAFHRLKEVFTTAPILIHPNPELPFIVEVDASSTGVGAVQTLFPDSIIHLQRTSVLKPSSLQP